MHGKILYLCKNAILLINMQSKEKQNDMMLLSHQQKQLAKHGYLYIQSPPNNWLDFIQEMTQGGIMPQDEGELIYDVKPTPGYQQLSNGKSKNALRPHTEASYRNTPPRYIVLRCLQPSHCGGGYTTLVDGYSLLFNLPPKVKNRLTQEHYTFISNQEMLEIKAPILGTFALNRPLFRFNYNALYYGQHSPTISYREEPKNTFLATFCQQVLHFFDEYKQSIRLEKKELLILDNYRMLHARSRFCDPNRHLQNVWIT